MKIDLCNVSFVDFSVFAKRARLMSIINAMSFMCPLLVVMVKSACPH
jgi:hypothetical protein